MLRVAEANRGDQLLFLQLLTSVNPPKFLDGQAKVYWRWTSFSIWLAFTFGSSFCLHLPSLWKKRVQLTKAFTALGHNWYSTLRKPLWFPADFFFPLLWTPVKLLRAVAHSILWEQVGRKFYALPVVLVTISFVLADMWNQVVFVQHDLSGGIVVLLFQFATMLSLLSYSLLELPSITKLFIPYTSAVCISLFLNVVLLRWNRPERVQKYID